MLFFEYMEPGEKPGYSADFFNSKPVIINIPSRIETCQSTESFNSDQDGLACQRVGSVEGDLENCQDTFAVRKSDAGVRAMAVTDGVGQTRFGGWGARVIAVGYAKDISTLLSRIEPFDEQKAIEYINQEAAPFIRDAHLDMVKKGWIAAATLIAGEIEKQQLIWRKVGDTRLIIIRASKGQPATLIEAHFQTPDRNSPDQISWDKQRQAWVLRGKQEEGTLNLQAGDVVIMFTDGLLKGGDFKGKSQEQIIDLVLKAVRQHVVFAAMTAYRARNISEAVLELGCPDGQPSDDVTVGVMVV